MRSGSKTRLASYSCFYVHILNLSEFYRQMIAKKVGGAADRVVHPWMDWIHLTKSCVSIDKTGQS